jgi:hypothetical protein
MNVRRAVPVLGLATVLAAGIPACKKTPTNAAFEVDEPTILFVGDPAAAPAGSLLRVSLFIAANQEEIRVFGLDVTFDSRILEFQDVEPGSLTGGWAAVDGNEVEVGSLRVGGFLGGGDAIPRASEGSLAEINFKVTGTGLAGGQQSQVCAKGYTDDLASFKPETVCFTFTLKN